MAITCIKGGREMKSVAVHITIPEELLKEVDRQAEREHRNRSEILREAIRLYLEEQRRKALEEQRLQRLLRALEESAGSWKDEAHPELKDIGDAHRLREELWEKDQKRLQARGSLT
jgi:Arc/MetJ-type ribon-helix-helix transcriptional regulator